MTDKGTLPKGSARDIRKAIVGQFGDMQVSSVQKSGLLVAGVASQMSNLGMVVTAGMSLVHGNVGKALAAFGVDLPKLSLKSPGKGAKEVGQGAGNLAKLGGALFARGGPITTGAPSGDTVAALLERGEYVLNRKAVKMVGREQLDRVNFGAAPRFQAGGIVELLHPDNDPAGHGGSNSHLHLAMDNQRALIALGRKLQKLGWLVGENPAFGGIQGRHAAGGYHPKGLAIDINWPEPGAELAKIRALLPQLGGTARRADSPMCPTWCESWWVARTRR